jgi:hypothetical protein
MMVRSRRCSTARASLAAVGAAPLVLVLLGGSCAGGDRRILARITGSRAHLYGENRSVRHVDNHACNVGWKPPYAVETAFLWMRANAHYNKRSTVKCYAPVRRR